MEHYIDICILPDAEMRENVLLNKVYSKFHKALCDLDANDIGVSFPKYRIKLGALMRIHGTRQRLEALQALPWLGGLSGYCKVGDILPVPDATKYRVISRIQSNMTEAKLRRLIKRGSITAEEARAYKAKMFAQGMDNPYLELESSSNGHKHRRYLQFGVLLDAPVSGEFDSFGLSKTATVPWF